MTEAFKLDPSRERMAFALASVLLLLPLAVFFLLPTQDGPVHTYNAELIRQALAGENGWFSQWLIANPRFDPTWPPHLVLVAMISVLPHEISEGLYPGPLFVLVFQASKPYIRAPVSVPHVTLRVAPVWR